MMDRSPQCYIRSYMEIRPPVREKIFESFFYIYGRGGHIGHVTWTIDINFGSPFPRRLHINLALIGQAVTEKKTFEIVDGRLRTTDAGPWVSYKLTYEPLAQVS